MPDPTWGPCRLAVEAALAGSGGGSLAGSWRGGAALAGRAGGVLVVLRLSRVELRGGLAGRVGGGPWRAIWGGSLAVELGAERRAALAAFLSWELRPFCIKKQP